MSDYVAMFRNCEILGEDVNFDDLLGAADEIERLRKMLRDQFEGWHDPDCKVWRESVKICTCGHEEAKAALAGTAHQF